MKSSAACLLLSLGLLAGPGRERTLAAGSSLQVAGKEYVRLTDWARANDFEVRWIKRDETVQLVKGTFRVQFSIDSREALINGVETWLSFPVLSRGGVLFLSQLDLQTAVQPVLAPPKNRPGSRVLSICLDAGHGGKDPGYRVGSNQEKKYTLLLAQEVREQLVRAGFKVTMTRTTDSFIELPVRPELARRRNADLFVSLHFNAAPSSASTVRGAEVYCLTPAGAASTNARGEGGGAGWFAGNRNNDKNMFLAYLLQRTLTKNLGVEDRGVHRARYAVLRDAVMPAVLIEGGFMSHPSEGKKIFDPAYRRQMAKAIVDGILAYKQAVEPAAGNRVARS
ncbi:MAG TPA: N-acetylmuramoyl-L-alanine amidase [Methylomirabilota bacterium]|nr:N-acetylmuramoyl-L-alanine amidase [Methylomirabilota bacterium]